MQSLFLVCSWNSLHLMPHLLTSCRFYSRAQSCILSGFQEKRKEVRKERARRKERGREGVRSGPGFPEGVTVSQTGSCFAFLSLWWNGQKPHEGAGVCSGSQLGLQSLTLGSVTGTWGSWSHCMRSQESGTDEHRHAGAAAQNSSPARGCFPLTVHSNTVNPTQTRSSPR